MILTMKEINLFFKNDFLIFQNFIKRMKSHQSVTFLHVSYCSDTFIANLNDFSCETIL